MTVYDARTIEALTKIADGRWPETCEHEATALCAVCRLELAATTLAALPIAVLAPADDVGRVTMVRALWACYREQSSGALPAEIDDARSLDRYLISAFADAALAALAPAPDATDALRVAARAIITDWNARGVGGRERLVNDPGGDYWSPDARMVSSSVIAALRAALAPGARND